MELGSDTSLPSHEAVSDPTQEFDSMADSQEPASMMQLQDTQDSAEPSSPRRDKGKGRVIDLPEEKRFDFMELPTELRLEIYRACLTRPYKILLAKYIEPPTEPVEVDGSEISDDESHSLHEDVEEERRHEIANLRRMRAARGLPNRNAANMLLGRVGRTGGTSRPNSQIGRPAAPRRRQSHTIRFAPAFFTPGFPNASTAPSNSSAPGNLQSLVPLVRSTSRTSKPIKPMHAKPPKSDDPLVVNILRLNKTIYKEARSLLYSENIFDLSIETAVPSLACLHQRSRRLIRQVELEIPSYTEIQDKFSEVVRLSLRYCSGLRKLVVHTPFCLPGGDGTATPNSNTQIWAQGFEILRWLPQTCDVELKGHKNVEIDEVVAKHLRLAKTLTPVSISFPQCL